MPKIYEYSRNIHLLPYMYLYIVNIWYTYNCISGWFVIVNIGWETFILVNVNVGLNFRLFDDKNL